ncbi:MAG: GNAT family N-acetyltransferase [Bacteriovoracaceae bacterium]|nr:GNAT family N-acetyltransferase [Bacteriovoracaceae bacterium]
MFEKIVNQNLKSKNLMLSPLTDEDISLIAEALFHPETFFVKERGYSTKELVRKQIKERLDQQKSGLSLTLVARVMENNEICAMSSYLFPSPSHHKVEIGFTWVAEKFKRSFVNTEMKWLMLNAAFENPTLKRVEFCVDPANSLSLRAMRRLGCVYEGTLRNFRFNSESDPGDRCIFSIISSDWPKLEEKLKSKIFSDHKQPPSPRPPFIGNYQDFTQADHSHYPGSEELLSIGSAVGKELGLKNLGVHIELLPPGRRTSWPHAESEEEEFAFVLQGTPQVWIDGHLYDLFPGDFVAFPAGTGVAHTFLNNHQKQALILVGGEKKPKTNKVFYPQHPQRNQEMLEKGCLWENPPRTTFIGGHDGRPNSN